MSDISVLQIKDSNNPQPKKYRYEPRLILQAIPGPGSYYQEIDKDKVEDLTESANKGSHYFKSSTKREQGAQKKGI